MKFRVRPAYILFMGMYISMAICCSGLDPSTDRILYAVGYGHLDDQWNWTIQDTINRYIPDSLQVNFPYFTNPNFTNYTFSFEGAMRYQWIHEYYPTDFLTLSNYVKQGRWHVAGSMITPSDVNIPSPEALIRHSLYANSYWTQAFGQAPVDLLLPDAFGFGYALPSVAAHCGIKGFSSMRAGPGSGVALPFQNIGRWIGPDGQSIVAVVDPGAYSQPVDANLANDSYHYNRINSMFNSTGLYLDYMYFGNAGDQGGGPSLSTVSNVCASVQTSNGLIHVLSVASDQMYRDLTPTQIGQLQAHQGEIVAQTLGTGGYTAHGELKRYNRQCELQAAAAEESSVMGNWLQAGNPYPQERLTTAWNRFLWHDMYDDITGVSIPAAYTFTWNDYLLSLSDFKNVETHGVSVLARALDTSLAGIPVIVHNPIATARQDLVAASITFDSVPPAVRVFDGSGMEVPSQAGPPTGQSVPVIFLAQVPAMGAAVYYVRPFASGSALSTGLSISTSQLENDRYRVQLNTNGDVASITDKLNNRQLLAGPIRWDFLYDLSTSLPAWEIQYNNIIDSPVSYLGGPATIRIVESGPARVSLEVTRQNAGSTFIERLRLGAGGAGDRVEWDILANWNTRQTLLKLEFPLGITNMLATYDLGLGTIQRPNNTARLYEVPAQQWADLANSNGTYGVTLMSDCKYGWDKPGNNNLRLSIFHTPAVATSFGHQAVDSFGTHRMQIALMGHSNDWRRAGSPWVAARLNQPLQAFQTTQHGPWSSIYSNNFSFVSCDNSNVMIRAVKKAESSSETIIRLQELTGQAQSATISSVAPILAARQLNGVESHVASLTPAAGRLPISVGAYAPVTVALTLGNVSAPLPAALDVPVQLPFNIDVISTDANRTDGNFDSGFTFPAELMPPSLVRDGITFHLGPTNNGALNAVACTGQTVMLNATGYTRLHLLAASAVSNTPVTFIVGGVGTNFIVPKFTGFIGQWSPPAQLTNQEVAWVCTHRHDSSGNNNAYNFCYLYKLTMELPLNAQTITLPAASNVRIFSMTASSNVVSEIAPVDAQLAGNLTPWANAGPNQVLNAPAANGSVSVQLDGSRSMDPDGVIMAYSWSLHGGIIATSVTASASLPIGTNVILLKVTDNKGEIGVGATTIAVLPPLNVTLTANPSNSAVAPLTVQFSGTASVPGGLSVSDTTDDHSGAVSAQGQNAGLNGNWEVATNIFDNDPATKWLDFATNNPTTRASWIQYQYPGGGQRVVTSYTLTSANDAPERDPANWALLGSNDGMSWVTLDSRTNQVFNTRFGTQNYTISSPAAYNIYRLRIDRVANPSIAVAVQLAEMQLLGPPVCSYYWSFGDGATAQSIKSGSDQQQHIYTNNGSYTVSLGVSCGIYTGTNRLVVTVGPPLQAVAVANPSNGIAPLTIQFSGQSMGGRTNASMQDTTDDHLGMITAQGENAGINGNSEIAANAFDNVTGTKWLDFANDYPNTRQSWIQYQYSNNRYAVSRYSVTSANDATIYPARNPANWRLLGSNDGGTTWTALDLRTNQVFTANFQKQVYNCNNTTPFGTYRFQIDRVANPAQAEAVQLDELEFLAAVPSFFWSFGDGTTSAIQNPQHTYSSNGIYAVSLVVWDGLSSATNWFILRLSPPEVGVAKLGTNLMMSWPSWASNFALYTTTNLPPSSGWALVTNSVVLSNTIEYITLPIDGSAKRFYRLSKP